MELVHNDEDGDPVHVVGLTAVQYKYKAQGNSWAQWLENTCWLNPCKLSPLKPTGVTQTLAEQQN